MRRTKPPGGIRRGPAPRSLKPPARDRGRRGGIVTAAPSHPAAPRRSAALLAAAALLLSCGSHRSRLQDGDIVFQTSLSAQSEAIQHATHSPYSHVGMVLLQNGHPFVFEAEGQVRFTPLQEWIARGQAHRYAAKRLRDPRLLSDPTKLDALRKAALSYAGKPYDPYFDWSDDRMYCSELVWKVFHEGLGVELGDLQPLSSFDLSDELVAGKLAQRYGSKVPMDEKVISPSAIFNSPLLADVR